MQERQLSYVQSRQVFGRAAPPARVATRARDQARLTQGSIGISPSPSHTQHAGTHAPVLMTSLDAPAAALLPGEAPALPLPPRPSAPSRPPSAPPRRVGPHRAGEARRGEGGGASGRGGAARQPMPSSQLPPVPGRRGAGAGSRERAPRALLAPLAASGCQRLPAAASLAPATDHTGHGVARRGGLLGLWLNERIFQAAENAERRELFPVRKKSFDPGF